MKVGLEMDWAGGLMKDGRPKDAVEDKGRSSVEVDWIKEGLWKWQATPWK